MNKKIENIDIIKRAIEVEVEHKYIDIRGRTCPFSQFILGELRNIQRMDKINPKWKTLINLFEGYAQDDLSSRMKAIRQLVSGLKKPFENPLVEKATFSRHPDETDVMYIKGVGPKLAGVLNKIGIYTATDLLTYYPRKYLDYSIRTKIRDLIIGEEVCIFGTIKSVNAYTSKRGLNIITILVSDGTGMVAASWFYGRTNPRLLHKYKAQYPKGANVILTGKVKYDDYLGKLAIDNAQATIVGDLNEGQTPQAAGIVPVYALTENLNVKTLRNAIKNAIELYAGKMDDFLPNYIKTKLDLMDKTTAVSQIHSPDSQELLDEARRRLVFEELFVVQLRLAYMRKMNKITTEGNVIEIKKDGLVDKFVNSLPFELTNGQNNAFQEILNDLQSNEPMGRLLQGDVGSGKTVVACMTLLSAIENGYQTALMAPTEILAEQHYKNFVSWLTPLGLSVGLFVGKHGAKIRREMRENLLNGQTNLAIGTHALIQDDVEFQNLGAVVVDEQHRFGVKQRAVLKAKGLNPEMLTMSATPIPRTLALTVHGDLDLTVIDEMPKGRKPVQTALLRSGERKKAHNMIKQEIISGNQAYIVFPLIEESETLSAKAATKEAEKLRSEVFPQYRIGLVHGKLSPKEKDEVMEDFRNKKYDILVSTTVIEVGVDVPDATIMIIENAERFGLSQLHQLRGRVGRSDKQSYCILITESKNEETYQRLNIMTQTTNGFVIAEKDLEIRGPGEFMGTRQSGLPDLSIADIVKDTKLLELAREEAFHFIENEDIKAYPELEKCLSQKILQGIEMINSG
jgi:ATP-dependent DNA helicase RecG